MNLIYLCYYKNICKIPKDREESQEKMEQYRKEFRYIIIKTNLKISRKGSIIISVKY